MGKYTHIFTVGERSNLGLHKSLPRAGKVDDIVSHSMALQYSNMTFLSFRWANYGHDSLEVPRH